MVLVRLVFLIQPVYSSIERSQSISLNDSGNPLNIVNILRGSPNFCNLSGYFSPPTRLPPIARSQTLARSIISVYHSYNTTYIIDLNLKIYRSLPRFEPRSTAGTKSNISTIVLYFVDNKKFFLFVGSVAQSSFWLLLQAVAKQTMQRWFWP